MPSYKMKSTNASESKQHRQKTTNEHDTFTVTDIVHYRKYLISNNAKGKHIQIPENIKDVLVNYDRKLVSVGAEKMFANRRQDFASLILIIMTVLEKGFKNVKRSISGKDENETTLRKNFVSEELKNCKSSLFKAVIKMFCVPPINASLRLTVFVDSLLRDVDETLNVDQALTNLSTSKNDWKLQTASLSKLIEELDEYVIESSIKGFLFLSDILKDRNYSIMAYMLDEEKYLEFLMTKHQHLNTVHPYYKLLSMYLNTCISPNKMKQQQQILNNQLKTSPLSTVKSMLEELNLAKVEQERYEKTRKTKAAFKRNGFDPNVTYETLIIPNLNRFNINSCSFRNPEESAIYTIQTYQDCLYDVIGCRKAVNGSAAAFRKYIMRSYRRSDENESTSDDQSENNESIDEQINLQEVMLPQKWSDRLKLINYRSVIELRSMTGEELNAIDENCSIIVSWLVDGMEHRETKTIHKRYNTGNNHNSKKRKNDVEKDAEMEYEDSTKKIRND